MAFSLSESLRITQKQSEKQKKKRDIQGVGVLIVDPTGQSVLVVNEKTAKDDSKKTIGECSPPLETVKKGMFGVGRERLRRTILGALAEAVNDTGLKEIKKDLLQIPLPDGKITLSPTVTAHVALFVFRGDMQKSIFASTASEETANPHWVKIDTFLADPNARLWGKALIEFAQAKGYLLPSQLQQFSRRSVLRGIRSFHTFYSAREKRKDISLV